MSELNELVAKVQPMVLEWRRHIHQHPCLSYHEEPTAQYVLEQLSTLPGLRNIHQPTATSVVADLVGDASGPTYALRADMDALPVVEATGLPFASQNEGVMHACGHDCHTAMLLGAAWVLCHTTIPLHGTVRFIFQHAEEMAPGGAQELVALGVLSDVQRIFGIHVSPEHTVGQIATRNGVLMGSCMDFDITITGRGGHASTPEMCIDPIVVGSAVVMNLQTVVSRMIAPLQVPVITIGCFQAGETHNVIPSHVLLRGTVRSLNTETCQRTPGLINQVVNGITAAYGATCDIQWQNSCKCTVNDAETTDICREVGRRILPRQENIIEMTHPLFGVEDFSEYACVIPGSFTFLGCSTNSGNNPPCHHPQMMVDENCFQYGVHLHVGIIENLLMNQSQ